MITTNHVTAQGMTNEHQHARTNEERALIQWFPPPPPPLLCPFGEPEHPPTIREKHMYDEHDDEQAWDERDTLLLLRIIALGGGALVLIAIFILIYASRL